MASFTINRIETEKQGDRVLLFGHYKWDDYHVICPANTVAQIGDVVVYEPEGYNFGWFTRIIPKK